MITPEVGRLSIAALDFMKIEIKGDFHTCVQNGRSWAPVSH
jgi:hypothetical protein